MTDTTTAPPLEPTGFTCKRQYGGCGNDAGIPCGPRGALCRDCRALVGDPTPEIAAEWLRSRGKPVPWEETNDED